MRKIPKETLKATLRDKFMNSCCLCDATKQTHRIEIHHNLIYAGRQSDDRLSFLPLCTQCHKEADNTFVRERLDWIMFSRGLDLRKYPKSQLPQRKKYVESIYGDFINL